MTVSLSAFVGADIFDGHQRHAGHALIVDGERISEIVAADQVPSDAERVRLDGGLLCPGFVDLQVNGGGGIMFNDDQSVATLQTMALAHASLGATSFMPTLITDTPQHTERAIDAVAAAIDAGVDGIIGLHLEGPHLSLARKGAHDPTLIRAMDQQDIDQLLDAAKHLPALKITLAPESVTPDQIAVLCQANILVSLGHSDASFAMCEAAMRAGASCVTHLFNAMSQLGNREPGLVGAALSFGELSAGLIADGIHVHPASVRAALQAKQAPGQIFLVSDAMAVAGSDLTSFQLSGRTVNRHGNRLTLEDGTLAGADLDMLQAVRNIIAWGVTDQGVSGEKDALADALAMATSGPAALVRNTHGIGTLKAGAKADILHLSAGLERICAVWQSGRRLD